MATRKLRVQLDVELEIDDGMLRDNNETRTDSQIAEQLAVQVPSGSFLSVLDEAIEVVSCDVRTRASGRVPRRRKA